MATSQGNHNRRAGVLPVGPSQVQTQAQAADVAKSTRAKAAAAQDGVKAKIRWLPPGLTEDEFLNILGDPWKLGKGRTSWFRYTAGHIPKSASKDPTPSWALLQVKEADVDALAQAVRDAVWEDAKGTFNSPSLIGPPYVERAIYKKIPASRSRKDPKEGTIDQDDEWQKFLVSLTENPDVKKEESEAAADDTTATEANAKPAVTNLVAHILESKANKAKETANAKGRKHARQESQGKGKGSSGATATTTSADEPKKKSKDKADKPKETVKILKKQAATEAAVEAAKTVAKEIKASATASEGSSNRRKLGISDILKRDLGLAGPSSSRKARQEAAAAAAAATAAAKSAEPSTQPSTRTKDKDKEKEKEHKNVENGAPASASNSAQTNDRSASTPTQKASGEKSSRGGRRRGKDTKTAESKGAPSTETAPATPVKPTMILQKKKEEAPAPTPAKEPVSNLKANAKAGSKSSTKSSQKNTQAAAVPAPSAPSAASTSAPASAAPSTPATAPTGPKANNTKSNHSGGSQKKGSANNSPSTATRAFLKHANPSQGVTEPLLREAMQAFGGVSSVEIDRRKGFAYVEFADHSSLAKAVAASPVTIANADVQVLERKDQTPKKSPTSAASNSNSSTQSPAAKEKEPPITPAAAAPPTPVTPAPSDKANNEQQQPKRSRRRGRGKGGNGGASGNTESKSGDQSNNSGGSASAARANTTSDAPKTG